MTSGQKKKKRDLIPNKPILCFIFKTSSLQNFFSSKKMQQTLFLVALLIAAASAALPRVPDNVTTIDSRSLLNPLGPEERRIYFRTSEECNKVFDNWVIAQGNCWFTQYCDIDTENTGYTGLPFLHVTVPPDPNVWRCRIDAPALEDRLIWVGASKLGFASTMFGSNTESDRFCYGIQSEEGYFPGDEFWSGRRCEAGMHCHMCNSYEGIHIVYFQFPGREQIL